jgi:hypothetical protein
MTTTMESRPLSEEGQGGPRQPVSFFRVVECGKKKKRKNDEKQGNKMMPWRTTLHRVTFANSPLLLLLPVEAVPHASF